MTARAREARVTSSGGRRRSNDRGNVCQGEMSGPGPWDDRGLRRPGPCSGGGGAQQHSTVSLDGSRRHSHIVFIIIHARQTSSLGFCPLVAIKRFSLRLYYADSYVAGIGPIAARPQVTDPTAPEFGRGSSRFGPLKHVHYGVNISRRRLQHEIGKDTMLIRKDS
jgi:hypothetical protein